MVHKEPVMPALPTGLSKHNGTYYYRRRIPRDLLVFYKATQIEEKFSLSVKTYKDAVERFYARDAKIQEKWRSFRQQLADEQVARSMDAFEVLNTLSEDDIQRITEHFESVALASDEKQREDGSYDISDILENQQAYSDALPILKAAVAVGDIEPFENALKQFLLLFKYDNKLEHGDFRRLALAYGRVAIRVNEKLLKRYSGEDVPTPRSAEQHEHGQTRLLTLTENYIKDEYPDGKKEAMGSKVKLVIPMFAELVGNKLLSAIRQSDVNKFFELVHQLWPRWSDEAKRSNTSWLQLAENNADLSRGEIAPGTFKDTYRAVISRFLTWAITNYQDEGFPTSLTVKLVEYRGSRENRENRQRAFKISELKRLFEGPEMQMYAADPNEHHRFWLPHVGLYTGARVNELCQLHPTNDIKRDKKSGLWFFEITEDGEVVEDVRKSVKTSASVRIVPVHSALVKLGFIDYVEKQRKRGAKLLFSPFRPSKGRASGEAEKWFRSLLEDTHLRDETPKARLVGMHAFRSTFLNRAMNMGVTSAEVITGHVHQSNEQAREKDKKNPVVRDYEGEMDLIPKSQILEQITWDEVKHIKPVK